MRIAIAIYGKRGFSEGREGIGKKLNLEITYNHLKKHILSNYKDTEIFIHHWDKDENQYLKKIFMTRNVLTEDQKDFGFNIQKMDLATINDELNEGAEFRGVSQMYSFYKVMDMIIKNELKSNIEYDFILCMRSDTLICKDLNFKKMNKGEIYLEKKINFVKKKIVDFKDNFDHKSFLVILNTHNIKKFDYNAIFSFNINNKDNFFNQFRPAIAFQSFQKPIFLNNKVNTSLPLGITEIIRRRYFEKEYFYTNNKLVDTIELGDNFFKSKKIIEYNNYIYDNFYISSDKINFFRFLKSLSIYLRIKMFYFELFIKWKIKNLKSFFNI